MLSALAKTVIQNSCVSVASRLVSGSSRMLDAYNPQLRQAGWVMSPEVTLKREGIVLGLAWGFSVLSNLAMTPLTQRFKLSRPLVIFLTTVIGSVCAEFAARKFVFAALAKSQGAKPSENPLSSPSQVATLPGGSPPMKSLPKFTQGFLRFNPRHVGAVLG